MLAFAAGLDVSLLSLVFQRRSGAATTDLAEATDAIKRGDTVVVIGGPAATALGQNAQAIAGAPHIVGSTTYLVGATADDSLAMAVAALK